VNQSSEPQRDPACPDVIVRRPISAVDADHRDAVDGRDMPVNLNFWARRFPTSLTSAV
jgi:hypothetical protein